MPYPNLVLIGPPKSGTTSVFNWLSEHSEVCTSRIKETYHFFQRDEEENGIKKFTQEDFNKYQIYFEECPNCSKCVIEATPEYLYSESAIGAFQQIKKPIKFLFIYRDPAERMFSDYQFHRYKTKRFKGTFEEYIGYNEGNFESKKMKLGEYQKYLRKWIDAFGSDKILKMNFDDLKKNPRGFMKELARKINIDPMQFEKLDFHQKNKTVKIKNRALHLALLKLAENTPKPLINILSPIYYKLNSGTVPEITANERNLKQKLKKYYKAINTNPLNSIS
ncbi:MAG: sulfotransferase domain-containing protein [Bacteroidota bacterium]